MQFKRSFSVMALSVFSLLNLSSSTWAGKASWSTTHNFENVKLMVEKLKADGKKPEEMFFSFDFDGVLGGRRTILKPKDQFERMRDVQAQEEKSAAILTYLNKEKIPFIVNTAASNPCRPRDGQMKAIDLEKSNEGDARYHGLRRSEMPCSDAFKAARDASGGPASFSYPVKDDRNHVMVKQCDCAFSAEYDKDIALLHALNVGKLKPKVVVHIDDGAINIVTMLENLHSRFDIHGFYYPTVPGTTGGAEPMHHESLQILNEKYGSKACGLGDANLHQTKDQIQKLGSATHQIEEKCSPEEKAD